MLAAIVGVLIFPLGSALPMPDWYANAARALPPWNFDFQFPDPPTGNREELISLDRLKLLAGVVLAALAAGFALVGRSLLRSASDRHATRAASRWRRAARVSRRGDASR